MDLNTKNIGSFFLLIHDIYSMTGSAMCAIENAKSVLPKKHHAEADKMIEAANNRIPLHKIFAEAGFPPWIPTLIMLHAGRGNAADAFKEIQILTDRLRDER